MPNHAPERRLLRAVLVGVLVATVSALGSPAIAATPATGELRGLVTSEGRPLGSVLVAMTPVDLAGAPSGAAELTFTDASGRYRFTAPADGAVKLHVSGPPDGDLADTWWPTEYTFARAGTILITSSPVSADVDLRRGGSVEGTVVDAATGTPIDGARVTASLPDEPPAVGVVGIGALTGAGVFRIAPLPPVPLQLAVELPPGSPYLTPAQDPGQFAELAIDGSANTSDLTIALRRGAEIRGRVTDDSGAPLAGTEVRLKGCSPTCPAPATTDATGAYRLVGVPPGTGFRVVAIPGQGLLGPSFPSSGLSTPIDAPRVEAGDVIDSVDIALTRAAFLTLEVQGLSGDLPVPAVLQLITGGRIYNQYVAIGADSDLRDRAPGDPVRVRVGPVPPGQYALRIRPGAVTIGQLPTRWVSTARDDATPTIELAAGVETDVVVRLGAGADAARWPADAAASWPAAALDDPGGGADQDAAPQEGATQGAGSGAAPSGGWPGLRQGFLAPQGWRDPFVG
jgi:hypothetical protein